MFQVSLDLIGNIIPFTRHTPIYKTYTKFKRYKHFVLLVKLVTIETKHTQQKRMHSSWQDVISFRIGKVILTSSIIEKYVL